MPFILWPAVNPELQGGSPADTSPADQSRAWSTAGPAARRCHTQFHREQQGFFTAHTRQQLSGPRHLCPEQASSFSFCHRCFLLVCLWVFFFYSAGVKCCLHISRPVMASLSHLSEDLRGFRLNISRCSAGTESPFPSCVCGGSGLLFHTAGPRGIGATRPH